MMNSDTPLDYAVFQLSPRRSRCELFVSGNGNSEKLASGFVKPFISNLKFAEEQVARAGTSIKLEVQKSRNGGSWFNKGTIERFVRFVSTPEVLESVNAYGAEMSQLEGARKIYLLGSGDSLSGTSGEDDTTAAADSTKKELLRAIDVRLVTVKQDLATACTRASSAGFSIENVSELLFFAEYFGANRLNEECNKFISLSQRHPDLVGQQQWSQSQPLHIKSLHDGHVRSSSSSEMSIDDPEPENNGSGIPSSAGGLQLHKAGVKQPSHLNTKELSGTSVQAKPTQQHLERVMVEEPAPSQANDWQHGGNLRKLSVQDRINLFEIKQKEQSASSKNISTPVVVNRLVQGKGEHRRLPSDVSEKSVLRRWSGVSGMSIDLSSSNSKSFNDHSESGSAVGTPTSANSQLQSKSETEETTEAASSKDMVTLQCPLDLKESSPGTSYSLLLSQSHCEGLPGDGECTEEEGTKFLIIKNRTASGKGEGTHGTSLHRMNYCRLDDEDASRTHQKGHLETSTKAGSKGNSANHIQLESEEHVLMENQASLPDITQTVSAVTEQVRWRHQDSLWSQTGEFPSRGGGVGVKDQRKVVNQFQTFGRRIDPDVKAKDPSDSLCRLENSSELFSDTDLFASQSQGIVFPTEIEEAGEINAAVSNQTFVSSLVKRSEESNHLGKNWPLSSTPERGATDLAHTKRNLPGVEEIVQTKTNRISVFPPRKTKETLYIVEPPSAHHMEQVQVARLAKGNQELDDELQMKANELEKFFASHKSKTHSEQTTSSRRSIPEVQEDDISMTAEKRHAVELSNQLSEKNMRETSKDEVGFDGNFLLKTVGNQECGSSIKQNFNTPSPSDDSRGKFYYKYMEKRDAKLQEEWGTKRVQKEAKMKAMRDSLQRSVSEMKSKYSGSADGQRLRYRRCRAENLMSFSNISALRSKNQEIDSVQEDGDREGYGEDTSYNEPLGDHYFRSTNTMNLLSAKTLSTSTPRTLVASMPKPRVKPTKSVTIKRRSQTENPLTESLPNFSDFRKENAKPSAPNNKVNIREKTKLLSQSKSIIEESNLVKEDKTCRSQSMRKAIANTGEFKDLSPLNSNGTDLTPLGFSKAQTDCNFINKVQKSGDFKPFLRAGKGTFGGTIAKTSKVSEVNKNGDDSEGMIIQQFSSSLVKDVLVMDRSSAEGDFEDASFPVDSENEKPQLSQRYENSDGFGSENDDRRSLCQADCCTVPASPTFGTSFGNVQASPGESPHSWNPHFHHSFSYAHETSDIDAYIDSPISSPASWNLHPNQMEADAARMRKKWGNAQMPMIVANASHQSHNDVTKGFKRILKFGRKSRGVDGLLPDWVSASTASDGDDDTEDGHYFAVRPTDDSRKSRMGYSLPQDGFNDREIFAEQGQLLRSSIPNPPANFRLREDHLTGSSLKAPRSFFSLSSFRSKESMFR